MDDFLPSLGLHATWVGPGWPGRERAFLGNTLKPEQVQNEPIIALHDMQASSSPRALLARNVSYAVILTDPDAPSRDHPRWAEYCHWIATGVLAPALCDPKEPAPCAPVLTDLDEVVKYRGPSPPEKTGKHRYVLLAFIAGNGTTDRLHVSKPGNRKRWGYSYGSGYGRDTTAKKTKGVREWADENGLVPVGEFEARVEPRLGDPPSCRAWLADRRSSRGQLYLCQALDAVTTLASGRGRPGSVCVCVSAGNQKCPSRRFADSLAHHPASGQLAPFQKPCREPAIESAHRVHPGPAS